MSDGTAIKARDDARLDEGRGADPAESGEPEALPAQAPGAAAYRRNPLLDSAGPLLRLAPRIHHCPAHRDPAKLIGALAGMQRQFHRRCRERGMPEADTVAASYVLCAFIDECLLAQPWGEVGMWQQQGLLERFHRERSGEDKVFRLGARLSAEPARFFGVLELFFVVLALGFQGRYRSQEQGREQLELVREQLAGLLREQAGASPPAPLQEPVRVEAPVQARPAVREGRPLWIVALLAAAAVAALTAALRMELREASRPLAEALSHLDVPPLRPAPHQAPAALEPAAPVASSISPPAALTAKPPPSSSLPEIAQSALAAAFSDEAASGQLDVVDLDDRTIVTVRGDALFAPGQVQVAEPSLALLSRIAGVLAKQPGPVVVSGHTDNAPVRSRRYASNWQLSEDRARAVGALLALSVDPARIRTEGRADSEPVDDNRSEQGRARNRRVEITLFAPAPPKR